MTATKTGGLAAIKRRIAVGTRLLCVRNTYRPVLDGTVRTVTRVMTVAFTWKADGDTDTRPSWTRYPKADWVTWTDDDTFRLRLGLRDESHYVELKFLP